MTIAAFNEKVHPSEHRLGGWRSLYLSFIRELKSGSIIEFGCGGNTFLSRLPEGSRRAGIDGGNRFEDAVKRIGAEFYSLDLDHDVLPDIGPFDVVVCSDVLEHLLYPERTVEYAARLASAGIFFSHVPNEYHWKRTLKVMLGRETSVYFHHGCEEWENPHLRRFTDSGFLKLLGRHFAFNLDISDLRASRLPQFLARIGIKPPYCLKGGPTYASTNNEAVYKKLVQAKKALRSSAELHS